MTAKRTVVRRIPKELADLLDGFHYKKMREYPELHFSNTNKVMTDRMFAMTVGKSLMHGEKTGKVLIRPKRKNRKEFEIDFTIPL